MRTVVNAHEAIQWLQQNTEMRECRINPDRHLMRCYLSVRYHECTMTVKAFGHDAAQAAQRAALKMFYKSNNCNKVIV